MATLVIRKTVSPDRIAVGWLRRLAGVLSRHAPREDEVAARAAAVEPMLRRDAGLLPETPRASWPEPCGAGTRPSSAMDLAFGPGGGFASQWVGRRS